MSEYPLRGLHGQTVQTLGMRILGGVYAPGDPLPPEQLERELGVSKTVVREAMRVLAAKGLVESRQKRGTVIRPRSAWSLLDPELLEWQQLGDPDPRFLVELAEVRGIVEPAGARLAALRRTDDDLALLDEALDDMVEAGRDAERLIAADMRFHRSLLGAAHNELLFRMEVVIVSGLNIRDRLVHHRGDKWSDPVPAHRALLTAVRDGDVEASSQAMKGLLEQAERDVLTAGRRSQRRKRVDDTRATSPGRRSKDSEPRR